MFTDFRFFMFGMVGFFPRSIFRNSQIFRFCAKYAKKFYTICAIDELLMKCTHVFMLKSNVAFAAKQQKWKIRIENCEKKKTLSFDVYFTRTEMLSMLMRENVSGFSCFSFIPCVLFFATRFSCNSIFSTPYSLI